MPPSASSTTSSATSATSTATTAALNKQRQTHQTLSQAVASLSGSNGVPYNGVKCVSVGPGGTGKTAMRRNLQGLRFEPNRESTRGGDVQQLVIQLQSGRMLDFALLDAKFTQQDLAILYNMKCSNIAPSLRISPIRWI